MKNNSLEDYSSEIKKISDHGYSDIMLKEIKPNLDT